MHLIQKYCWICIFLCVTFSTKAQSIQQIDSLFIQNKFIEAEVAIEKNLFLNPITIEEQTNFQSAETHSSEEVSLRDVFKKGAELWLDLRRNWKIVACLACWVVRNWNETSVVKSRPRGWRQRTAVDWVSTRRSSSIAASLCSGEPIRSLPICTCGR